MPGHLPERPPLDLRQDGHIWTVEPYRGEKHSGPPLATEASRLDAVREARRIMDERRHPCLLEWQSEDSVCNLYWNPLFETLQVEHDELLDAWVVTTPSSAVSLATGDELSPTIEQAKSIQRRCHFKKLRVHDSDGNASGTREHRFLRHRITDTGVKFNEKAVESPPDVDHPPADEAPADAASPAADTPANPGQLAIQVPDITDIEVVDTSGVLNHFRTPWNGDTSGQRQTKTGGETLVDVLALPSAYASEKTIAGFKTQLQRWIAADSHDHIATVYEWGMSPTPTVAFATGTPLSARSPFDLDREARLAIISQLAKAVKAWPCEPAAPGIAPESVYLVDAADSLAPREGTPQVLLTRCGIERRLRNALGNRYVTPFVAPEQLQGRVHPTTAVYQLAALAYWLLCERPPVEAEPLDRAILTGQIRDPQIEHPSGIKRVLLTGLANKPADRYDSITDFQQKVSTLRGRSS